MSVQQKIEKAAKAAAEWVKKHGADSVVVIATAINENGFTVRTKYGEGNFYAQRGSVEEWLETVREAPMQPPPPPDDADLWKLG